MFKNVRSIIFLLLGLPSFSAFGADVSVLVLYTEGARIKSVGDGVVIDDKVQFLIDASNESYQKSGIDINLTLAGSVFINNVDDSYTETKVSGGSIYAQRYSSYDALDDLIAGTPGPFGHVHDLRNAYGADFVVLLRDVEDVAGLAWVEQKTNLHKLRFSERTYSIVWVQDESTTFAHELGHNMGLAHSRRQVRLENGSSPGYVPYAAGHGIDPAGRDKGFVTIMAYSSEFNDAQEMAVFSNPNIGCKTNTSTKPCGVHYTDQDNGADAAKVLNSRKNTYANYRPGPYVRNVSVSDASLDACLNVRKFVFLRSFTSLDCPLSNIKNLEGIQGLGALTYVNLQNNQLLNIEPLLELPNLQTANLVGNDSVICNHLERLENQLGQGYLIRPNSCFPLVAILVTSILL